MSAAADKSRSPAAAGFSMIELLVVIAVMAVLASLSSTGILRALEQARATASSSNLRQLVQASSSYAVDHNGSLPPAQSPDNLTRWHGGRRSLKEPFEPERGFLAAYLGPQRRVGTCPLLRQAVKGAQSWEDGTGGYGYNAAYIGGGPGNSFRSARAGEITRPSLTVMFTTSGFAKREGVQEYPYSEPYRWLDTQGVPAGRLQPSTHFRANGRALVAWADGRVSREAPNEVEGPNYYRGDNRANRLGWFGPEEDNGYWNPRRGQ